MKLKNKTIGIWGFGRVGVSAASFFHRRNARVIVYDNNQNIVTDPYITAPSIETLFSTADYVVPSPGIDIRSYRTLYQTKWLSELDIFQAHFKKPIIAVTGSIGKTTITHVLANLLAQQGIRVIAAGNIGLPMLDIIEQQDLLDMVVLELSSFQLEFVQTFAPHLAIWTNLYPNHLDRHGTMDNYFAAKFPILKQQRENQYALLPYDLHEQLVSTNLKSSCAFFTKMCPETAVLPNLFCLHSKNNEMHHHQSRTSIALDIFPSNIFPENWLIIWAAFHILRIPYPQKITMKSLDHRLEKVAEINGVTFYNDSKSTTPTSTLAALEQFKTKRILLFLGGLSKGIDRTPLIKALKSYAIQVFCFGKEAAEIKALCDTFAISCNQSANLEDAFQTSLLSLQGNECVLFSPSGSSYDLFKNYEERGNAFKKLVQLHKTGCC